MRNLIIGTSIVFIAVLVVSYLYFSRLGQLHPNGHEDETSVEDELVIDGQPPTNGQPLWAFEVNSGLIRPPSVYLYDDTLRFILVQDAYHILHAISIDGQKHWNAQLPGPILGDIQQFTDHSLVFTTAERLYRIDTEGDPLPGFSVRLPQKATDGALATAENSENIRIEVPAGNRIMSYDGRGRLQGQQSRGNAVEQAETQQELNVADCGPFFYTGPLHGDGRTYLLCGKDDGKLYCYIVP